MTATVSAKALWTLAKLKFSNMSPYTNGINKYRAANVSRTYIYISDQKVRKHRAHTHIFAVSEK